MKITEIPVVGYERVTRCDDPDNGLTAFISVHDTTLGPALGGMRMWPYLSEKEAFTDVNRLARGMTYKSAVAETGMGGGKAVIIGDPETSKSTRLLQAMGRFVDSLGGLYITAEDVGMSVDDMVIVRQQTPYVTGLPQANGSSGNPAPMTARGIFLGMQACLERQLQTERFTAVRIAVQGCGNVASHLCAHLKAAGAELIVTDIAPEKAQALAARYGARVVAPEDIYHVDCEVYAPCALGGTLNAMTIPQLKCAIVAGSANNQCLDDEQGDHLRQRGILYAPDFVINAGGVLNIAMELAPGGYNQERAMAKVCHIANVLRDIFDMAERQHLATHRAAILLAERKLAEARASKEGGSAGANTQAATHQ